MRVFECRNDGYDRFKTSHLCSHFNQHEQLLDADPHSLVLHSFGYVGPFLLLEAAQQLWSRAGQKGRAGEELLIRQFEKRA